MQDKIKKNLNPSIKKKILKNKQIVNKENK